MDNIPSLDAIKHEIKNSHGNVYNIVSIVGYLIGVDKRFFESGDNMAMQQMVYDELETKSSARIIRSLCRLRTALVRNRREIDREWRYGCLKNIDSTPDYIPAEDVRILGREEITFYLSPPSCERYLMHINTLITQRISGCRNLFPEWLKWDYVRKLFVMPGGTKPDGVQASCHMYAAGMKHYPYQCYISWEHDWDGNMLFNDQKFVQMLYRANGDSFNDLSLIRTADDSELDCLKSFLDEAGKILFVVDCENSNPLKTAAAIGELSEEHRSKIAKILLFDSRYTTKEWETFAARECRGDDSFLWTQMRQMSGIPMERVIVERVVEHKSQVDMALAVRATKEVYTNDIDSIVLASSDSDYWALISNLPQINFMVMLEKSKTGSQNEQTLRDNGTRYCWLDDFYTGISYSIKIETVKNLLQNYLNTFSINIYQMFEDCMKESWIDFTDKEKQQFRARYIDKCHVDVDEKGMLSVLLGEK